MMNKPRTLASLRSARSGLTLGGARRGPVPVLRDEALGFAPGHCATGPAGPGPSGSAAADGHPRLKLVASAGVIV